MTIPLLSLLLLTGTGLPSSSAEALIDEAAAGSPSALPADVRAIIRAAIESGDGAALKTVLGLVRKTHGAASAEIDAIQSRWDERIATAEAEKKQLERQELAQADLLDAWKGQIELGASRSTGSSRNLGLYSSVALEREGLEWRHRLALRADLQESRGVTSTKRVLASWQPNYRLSDRLYSYGLGQFEYDPIQGYDGRYTVGGGVGFGVIATPKAVVDFEGGPAVRYLDATKGKDESTIAGRASVNVKWAIAPTLELKQTSAIFYESGESSANSLTSVDAHLIGPLKARFSYDVRYETGFEETGEKIDTSSRATLVYSF